MSHSEHSHLCVWLDHRQARIFGIGLDASDEAVLREPGPPRHIHRKADWLGEGKAPPDQTFLGKIAETLTGAHGLLLVGPGTAKTELAGYLRQHHPAIAGSIWAIEPMDHPTDAEIIQAARRFFRAAERMHD